MKQSTLALMLLFVGAVACPARNSGTPGSGLTDKEIADGWLVLFDGKSTKGWNKNSWKVQDGELVSPGDNSPLQSSREFKDFELTLEFCNDGDKKAVLGFGKYSERDSHPVRIYLHGNHAGWQKLRITAEGCDAAGIIHSIKTSKDPIFPEAVIRAESSTLVPLVFKGPNLRLRNIKIRPLKPVEK